MSVAALFALIGGVILAGFLANLLFRVTKLPAVLLLIGVGVLLGPATGWLRSEALVPIAPFFGAMALLIILFEGGLELEIGHVARQAPRAALLAVVVFALSLALVAAFAHLAAGFPLIPAVLLGAILGATSPAICIPVVTGLSVRDEVKTIVKLESALGDVLLIVAVVLLLDARSPGASGGLGWLWTFARSLLLAVGVSSIAGVLWSRLIGWMGHEPLAYMLTLGIVFLLYFAVEELGGSAVVAVLVFGLMLANMGAIAARVGPRLRELLGVDLREEQFVLNQLMVRITAELSFLVRTFFFVYLGLLIDLSALSWTVGIQALGMFALLLVSRHAGVALLARGRLDLRPGELQAIMALAPRGLATAVMAFVVTGANVERASLFPVYAFAAIILSNVFMTAGVLFAERRLRAGGPAALSRGDIAPAPLEAAWPSPSDGPPTAAEPAPAAAAGPSLAPLPLSPEADFAGEPTPATFTDWLARSFGLRLADRETEYVEMIRASYLREPLFWIQAVLGAAICALGLIMNQGAIVIGGALIVPLAAPGVATGLALASGDLYLLAKLSAKLLGFALVAVAVSAVLGDIFPFSAAQEAAAQARPTLLDFLVALCAGMSGAALIPLRRRVVHYLPGAVIAIALLPPLCVMGFATGAGLGGQILRGSGLQFTANLFAVVLGAGTILALVGIPRAAESASVRQWKERELARPIVRAIFSRLRLQEVIGRTGSVRARLAVVGLFLLVVLVPLQLALNQLRLEFRTRQAVSRAQAAFNVPGRSRVVDSSLAVGADRVQVGLRVATNSLFAASDIHDFEARVAAELGAPTRLELVQTLGDVGQGDTIRNALFARSAPLGRDPQRWAADALREAGRLVQEAVSEVPLPDSCGIVTIRGQLDRSGEPTVEIVYLAGAELGADARQVIVRLMAQRARLHDGQVILRWLPASREVPLSPRGGIDAQGEAVLAAARTLLSEFPALDAVLELPAGGGSIGTRSARAVLKRNLEASGLRVTESSEPRAPGKALVRLTMRSPS